jgi:hypothetical protein
MIEYFMKIKKKCKYELAGLLERLNAGDPVLVAEGYLFEFERLGYLQAGGFVPEVVLEHPDRVRLLHEDFVHAGSDVVQAFTVSRQLGFRLDFVAFNTYSLSPIQFYTNPAKMAVQGRKPHEYEEINRKALRIAKEVAVKTGTLMCGDLSATNQYSPAAEDIAVVRQVFKVNRIPGSIFPTPPFFISGTSAMGRRGRCRFHCRRDILVIRRS